MEYLKERCPQCGSRVVVFKDSGWRGWNCGCSGYRGIEGLHTKKMMVNNCVTRQEAIDAWEKLK